MSETSEQYSMENAALVRDDVPITVAHDWTFHESIARPVCSPWLVVWTRGEAPVRFVKGARERCAKCEFLAQPEEV